MFSAGSHEPVDHYPAIMYFYIIRLTSAVDVHMGAVVSLISFALMHKDTRSFSRWSRDLLGEKTTTRALGARATVVFGPRTP